MKLYSVKLGAEKFIANSKGLPRGYSSTKIAHVSSTSRKSSPVVDLKSIRSPGLMVMERNLVAIMGIKSLASPSQLVVVGNPGVD